MQKVQESVNASNFLLVGNQTGNRTKSANENALNFAGFLTEAENASGNTVQKDYKTEKYDSVTSLTKDTDKWEDTVSEGNSVKKEDTLKNDEPMKKADSVSKEESVKAEESRTDSDLSEEEMAAVLEIMGNVLEMIMQKFGLSEEELAEQLKAFGMETADLFTSEGLKEFFLNMNMADVSDLIVDEDLNQELQSFLGEFKSLLQESDATEEQLTVLSGNKNIKEILTEISEFQDNILKTEEHPISDDQADEVLQKQEEPEVIVTGKKEQDNPSEQTNSDARKENVFTKLAEGKAEVKTAGKQEVFHNPILQAVQDAVNQVGETLNLDQPIQGRDVIEQIVEQIRVTMNQETSSMELQLYPEHLGKIQINVISKDGIMTARIVAETEAAKQAIENGLTNLKESMQQQNLKVDAIEVMVSTTGFERGNEEQSSFEEKNASKGSRRQIDLSELSEEESESDAEIERMKLSGSSVSYTA